MAEVAAAKDGGPSGFGEEPTIGWLIRERLDDLAKAQADLRGELAKAQADLRSELAKAQADLRSDLKEIKADLSKRVDRLEEMQAELKADLGKRMDDLKQDLRVMNANQRYLTAALTVAIVGLLLKLFVPSL